MKHSEMRLVVGMLLGFLAGEGLAQTVSSLYYGNPWWPWMALFAVSSVALAVLCRAIRSGHWVNR